MLTSTELLLLVVKSPRPLSPPFRRPFLLNGLRWLRDEYCDGDMPEIIRRANAFRGFPQLDDEDFNPLSAAERRAYYRSEKGREELRPYLPTIKKYAFNSYKTL
ncbi:hypothetical protein PG985_009936 [Apiospora marii]|uniref:uncharacterized protein n=1 Tax=Apiospora marii TaxID=335849 RepID=UPI0031322536